MTSAPDSGPVFLLTLHRGGGTVLARVLNCHPDLVIWGEHVGLINKLAEIDDMVSRVGQLMAPKTEEAIAKYVAFPDRRLTEFDPWANPFDYDAFSRSCCQMIEAIFTRGLRPGQRWGFKEIRYHRVLTVRFLEKLFPAGRFLILRRDICEVAVSAILAPWSLRLFWDYRETMPLEMAEAIVRDVTYAVLAIESGLDAVQAQLGPHCLQMDYSQLLDPALGFVGPLFDFLELDLSEPVNGRIREVLKVRSGGADHEVCFGGVLSRAFIRTSVTGMAPCLRAEIACDGIDKVRLTAREGLGQYSFLMGDHTLRDRGSEISSLF
jgi:Sulfotransferase family